MGNIIPGREPALELQRTHKRTFAIEQRENESLILYLRLTPTQTLSIVNGAPIDLVIGSPKLQPSTLTFRLNDVIGSPFWISRRLKSNPKTGQMSEFNPGLPSLFQELAQSTIIQVGLFDWNTKCVHAECVQITKPKQSLHEWLEKCVSAQVEQVEKEHELEYGYTLSLGPLSEKPDFIYLDYAFRGKIGQNPYIVSSNKHSDHLSISRYLTEGMHGYYQEHVLATEIAKCFQPGINLFISPQTKNNTELTDFVISEHDTIVFIESKASRPYEGNPRKMRTVESSFTRLIHKAFEQLQRAKEVAIHTPELIEDINLRKSCADHKNIIGICIVDDAWMINPSLLKTTLNKDCPETRDMGTYIIEIEDLFGLLARSRTTSVLIDFLLQLAKRIPCNGGIPLFNLGF